MPSWHCLRGAHVQPMGPGLLAITALLALTTRRPRSASGSRPSRNHVPFGMVCEASHAGQMHGEMTLATMTTWCCQLFRQLDWRYPNCLKARHKRVLNEIKDCALLTLPTYVKGGRFRTHPWYSGRCFHARLSKMIPTSRTPTIDQNSEGNVFSLKWFIACNQSSKVPKAAQLPPNVSLARLAHKHLLPKIQC